MMVLMVMVLLVRLNVGKYQWFCQCIRMKFIMWLRIMWLQRLFRVLLSISVRVMVNQVLFFFRCFSQIIRIVLMMMVIRVNSQCCQFELLVRKLKVVLVLQVRVQLNRLGIIMICWYMFSLVWKNVLLIWLRMNISMVIYNQGKCLK